MTTEEKANAYDEVIKKINSKWHYKNKPCFIDVAEIFPELKESEDERIRKAIIECVKNYGPSSANPKLFKSMLAWLEKQAEQKQKEYSLEELDLKKINYEKDNV